MSFIMGGLFANLFTPKPSKPIPFQEIPNGNELNSEERQPLLTSEGEKEFLSAIWLMEKEIKLAEAEENWVRLYCLLQTVRHLSENNWKKYLEGDFPYQDFLNDNLLSLLYYVLDMNPEETYWPKVSQRVKDTLEQGGLNVELEDLSYTFLSRKWFPYCTISLQ